MTGLFSSSFPGLYLAQVNPLAWYMGGKNVGRGSRDCPQALPGKGTLKEHFLKPV